MYEPTLICPEKLISDKKYKKTQKTLSKMEYLP